uniref:Uncharacterized protein n=1 Tax=Arcella intermedia TaxID=1963864 RepID=A0A6B2LJ88_9EUKA
MNILAHDKDKQPWWDRIVTNVVLGALPFHAKNHCERLIQVENVGAVVVMCRDFEFSPLFGKAVSPEDWRDAGVEVLHLPTEDGDAPNEEDIMKAVSFMHEFIHTLSGGKSVYVHCKSGRGRSVVVVVCFLVYSFQVSTEEAIEMIKKKRAQINMGYEQLLACKTFEKSIFPDRDIDLTPPVSMNVVKYITDLSESITFPPLDFLK